MGPDRRIVRRHVLGRRSSLVGLGKEGMKLAARFKSGKTASADPTVFIERKERLIAMGRAEARRLKHDWGTVQSRKRSLKKTGTLRGDALKRLKAALVGAG